MADERPNLEAELSAYIDDELTPERREAVERWLRESAEARALLSELRDVAFRVRALPRQAAPEALRARLAKELGLPARGGARSARILRLALRYGAAAAVLVGAVWVVRNVGRGMEEGGITLFAEPRGGTEPATARSSDELANANEHVRPESASEEAEVAVVRGVNENPSAPAIVEDVPAPSLAATSEPEEHAILLRVYPGGARSYVNAVALVQSWAGLEADATVAAARDAEADVTLTLAPEQVSVLEQMLVGALGTSAQPIVLEDETGCEATQIVLDARPKDARPERLAYQTTAPRRWAAPATTRPESPVAEGGAKASNEAHELGGGAESASAAGETALTPELRNQLARVLFGPKGAGSTSQPVRVKVRVLVVPPASGTAPTAP